MGPPRCGRATSVWVQRTESRKRPLRGENPSIGRPPAGPPADRSPPVVTTGAPRARPPAGRPPGPPPPPPPPAPPPGAPRPPPPARRPPAGAPRAPPTARRPPPAAGSDGDD